MAQDRRRGVIARIAESLPTSGQVLDPSPETLVRGDRDR
jgi:hypothetical protein